MVDQFFDRLFDNVIATICLVTAAMVIAFSVINGSGTVSMSLREAVCTFCFIVAGTALFLAKPLPRDHE